MIVTSSAQDAISTGNLLVKKISKLDIDNHEVGNYWFTAGSRQHVTPGVLDEFLDIVTGYFGSIRALEGGLNLNLDVMSALFYRGGQRLEELWNKMITLNRLGESERDLFKGTWTGANMKARAEVVESRWKKLAIHFWRLPRTFFIYAVDPTAAAQKLVFTKQAPNDGPQNLIDFVLQEYPPLRGQNLLEEWPALKVSKKSDYFVPWGPCETTGWSRFSGKLDDRVKTLLQRTVQRRYNDILQRVQSQYGGQPNYDRVR